jgi:hypothetical protein
MASFGVLIKSIWVRPMDYRDAVQGSPFDGKTHRGQSAYRRSAAREDYVERAVKKIELLGG